MQKFLFAAFMLLAVNQAQAGQLWNIMQWQIQPGKEAAALKAMDDLQKSDAAKSRSASVQFQSISFNGSSPATHAVVVLYPSHAEQDRGRKR